MSQLGANALGEVLEPGRVPDCYLGLLLDPTDHDTQAAGLLVVAPAALLHPHVPQLDGTVLYELVTGHPDRAAHELVFLRDLAVELRAWPSGTWARLGFNLQAAARGDHRRLAGRPPQGPPARGCATDERESDDGRVSEDSRTVEHMFDHPGPHG